LKVLAKHRLLEQPYSPSALEQFSACPYRFLLQAVHHLRPREEAVALEQMDPLTRGSLFHAVQFAWFRRLQAKGWLPLTADRVEDCLLLNKPLEPVAGGQGHEGADPLGRNLFASKADSGYLLLLRWARSTGLQPTAAEIDAANAALAPATENAP